MKRVHEDDSGQAMALGTALLVILAIGMYLVADFGNHVREKIHVQTTADATAYSLANMEAQAFNYAAFTNRAQVSHYVTMLNMQGWLSWASWAEYQLVRLGSVIDKVPMLSALADATWAIIEMLRGAINTLDAAISLANTGIDKINHGLWVSQLVVVNLVMYHVSTGGYDVANTIKHDPAWQPGSIASTAILGQYNGTKFFNAFDASGGGPLRWSSRLDDLDANDDTTDEPTARLQRAMTEIVNATRFSASMVQRPAVPIAAITQARNAIESNAAARGLLYFLEDASSSGSSGSRLVGAPSSDTKMTLDQIFASAQPAGVNVGGEPNNRGQTMASRDIHLWGKGGVWASAKAAPDRRTTSQHCRSNLNLHKGSLSPRDLVSNFVQWQCRDNTQDPNHHWEGIAPYLALAKITDASERDVGKFNQPDVIVWLNKSNREAGFGEPIKMSWKHGSETMKVDTTYGRNMGPLATVGVHAVARAQAYYHRPDNWQEPPNLWNPYWRARLMPVVPSLVWGNTDSALARFFTNLIPGLPTVYH